MAKEITITIPAIDESVITTLDSLTSQASATEVQALTALRETYAKFARHNGYVKIGWWHRGNQNWSEERDYHYQLDGKKVKGLLAFDGFEMPKTADFTGDRTGDRLYLLETGQWLRIERSGYWSQWQNATEWFACGSGVFDTDDFPPPEDIGGSIRFVTDEQVEAEYRLDEIVEELSKSLKTLTEKLPDRLNRVRQQAALASKLLEALK